MYVDDFIIININTLNENLSKFIILIHAFYMKPLHAKGRHLHWTLVKILGLQCIQAGTSYDWYDNDDVNKCEPAYVLGT